MIWIISSKVCRDKEEENSRYQFIKEVAGAKVSSLEKYFFEYRNFPKMAFSFSYQSATLTAKPPLKK